jgi:hypothetical protein
LPLAHDPAFVPLRTGNNARPALGHIEERPACFIVSDADGQVLA